jgi:glycosyltransferase involved in cell wall biosynthesis
MCDREPVLPGVNRDRIRWTRWSMDREVEFFQGLDVGLMPLVDSEWNRGKCSYKMLLYMACAAAVVVSPVGMNSDVLAMADLGRGASTDEDWQDALEAYITDPVRAAEQGRAGRRVVEAKFSLGKVAPMLASAMESALAGAR